MTDGETTNQSSPQDGVQQATAEAAAAASKAVSATADALNQAKQDGTALADQASDRVAAVGSQATAAFDEARNRLKQAGVPGIAETQGLVDQFKAGSELFSKRVRQDYGQSQKTMVEFNSKMVEAWRSNAEATISYWQRLSGVTNWSDLVALNTAHLRQQMEAITAQTRELAELAGRAARDGAETMTKFGR